MSKKVIAVLCAVVLAATVFAGCNTPKIQIPDITGNNDNVDTPATTAENQVVDSAVDSNDTNDSNNNNNNNNTTSAPAPVSADDIKASANSKASDGVKVEGITITGEYGSSVYLLITSDKDCDLSISVDFFMGDKIVGTTSSSVDAVAKGVTICEDFSCDEAFDTYEYKVITSDLSYTVPVDQNLALDVSVLTNKVIVSLTNNGKIPAKYVWYDVFFLKDGKVVDHNYSYCEDDDSEIKVGATERSECSCWADEGFDDARVYFHGEGYND